MLLDICALFPTYVRHLDAVKLLLKCLPILVSFTMFVTAKATGLVGRERSNVGSHYPAYVPNSKPKLRHPTFHCCYIGANR